MIWEYRDEDLIYFTDWIVQRTQAWGCDGKPPMVIIELSKFRFPLNSKHKLKAMVHTILLCLKNLGQGRLAVVGQGLTGVFSGADRCQYFAGVFEKVEEVDLARRAINLHYL